MGAKRIARRSKIKPFIKVSPGPGVSHLVKTWLIRSPAYDPLQTVNYAHLLPTRYALELESLKGTVSSETFKEPTQREDAKKAIKKHFEERYARGANRWFFTKLRF